MNKVCHWKIYFIFFYSVWATFYNCNRSSATIHHADMKRDLDNVNT